MGGPFLCGFWSSENASQFRKKMTKISDFVFFIWVIFLQKREIFAYFWLYFQIFYVFNPWGKRNSGTLGQISPFLRPNCSFFLIIKLIIKFPMFLTPDRQAVTIWLQIDIFYFFLSLSSII